MPDLPYVTIHVVPDVGLQIKTNLQDPVVIVGLLESGKHLLLTQPLKPESPLITPRNRLP